MSSSESTVKDKGKASRQKIQKRKAPKQAPAIASDDEAEELSPAQAMALVDAAAAALRDEEKSGLDGQRTEQGEEQGAGEKDTSIERSFPTLFNQDPARKRWKLMLAENVEGLPESLGAKEGDMIISINGVFQILPQFTAAREETENERIRRSIFKGAAIIGSMEGENYGEFNENAAERLGEFVLLETDKDLLARQTSGIPMTSIAGAAAMVGLLADHIKVLGAAKNLAELNVLLGTLRRVGDKFLKNSEERAQQEEKGSSGGGSSGGKMHHIEVTMGGISSEQLKKADSALAGNIPMVSETARCISRIAAAETDIGGGEISAMTVALLETNLGQQIPEAAIKTAKKLLALGRPTVAALVAMGSVILNRDPGSVPTGAAVTVIVAVGVAVFKTLHRDSVELKDQVMKVFGDASMQQLGDAELAVISSFSLLEKVAAAREDSFAQKKKPAAEVAAAEAVRKTKVHDFVLKGSLGTWPPNVQSLLSGWRQSAAPPAAQGQRPAAQGQGQAAHINQKRRILLASERAHCVPFQTGACTGSSTATCPQKKNYVLVKCNRPYPPGGKCQIGADCHFVHI